MSNQTLELVTWLVTVLAPILVGLVTKASTSSSVKAVALAVISAAVGVGNQWIDAANSGAAFDVVAALYAATGAFVVAVAIHYGIYKPTGVTVVAQNHLVKDSADPVVVPEPDAEAPPPGPVVNVDDEEFEVAALAAEDPNVVRSAN